MNTQELSLPCALYHFLYGTSSFLRLMFIDFPVLIPRPMQRNSFGPRDRWSDMPNFHLPKVLSLFRSKITICDMLTVRSRFTDHRSQCRCRKLLPESHPLQSSGF